MIDKLKYFDGDLKDIDAVPADLQASATSPRSTSTRVGDRRRRPPPEVDRPVAVAEPFSLNPDLKTLSHMYRHAWHAGLKTTYYLRTLGASTIEKATVSAAAAVPEPEPVLDAVACSILNGEECEACQ